LGLDLVIQYVCPPTGEDAQPFKFAAPVESNQSVATNQPTKPIITVFKQAANASQQGRPPAHCLLLLLGCCFLPGRLTATISIIIY